VVRLFITLQYLLPHHLLGRVVYALSRSRRAWLKNALIRAFVRHYRPQMADALEAEPTRYESFSAFFTRALKPGARLIVIDRIVPENLESDADTQGVILSDLNMLRGPGGCERTVNEFRALLLKGGFRMERALSTGRYFVIEATRV